MTNLGNIEHQCHQCGMRFEVDLTHCPKCDYGVTEQNQKQILTKDIAHNRQTIDQATREFYATLNAATEQNFGQLRLIVGGGKIRDEIGYLLETEQWRGTIRRYELEHPNSGAYLIKL